MDEKGGAALAFAPAPARPLAAGAERRTIWQTIGNNGTQSQRLRRCLRYARSAVHRQTGGNAGTAKPEAKGLPMPYARSVTGYFASV